MEQLPITGRYFGPAPTETERESGTVVEVENMGPLKPGKAGHRVLMVYTFEVNPITAYEASQRACGDYHAMRRESTRLLTRGYLRKEGQLPNPAPRGRKHVDAFVITNEGITASMRLTRELNALQDAEAEAAP